MKNVPETTMIDQRSCASFHDFSLCPAAYFVPVTGGKKSLDRGGMTNFHVDNTDNDINPPVGIIDHSRVEAGMRKVCILLSIFSS